MPQNNNPNAVRPLPGLAKVFLFIVYPLALTMLCSRIIFSAVPIEKSIEPTLWSITFLISGVGIIAGAVGLHTHSTWALRLNSSVCLLLCSLCIAGLIRIAIFFSQLSRYYGDINIFATISPLATYLAIFYAFYRYFSGSEKIFYAMGLQAPEDAGQLPPMGVAILKVIAASYLLFYANFFCVVMLTQNDGFSKTAGYIALFTLPFIVASVLAFIFTSRRAKNGNRLIIGMLAFALVAVLWQRFCQINLPAIVDKLGAIYSFYSFFYTFSSIPLSTTMLTFALGILAWYIWAMPAEQAWLKNEGSTVRQPSFLNICSLIIIYECSKIMLNFSQAALYHIKSEEKVGQWAPLLMLAFAIIVIALSIANIYNQNKDRWNAKRLSMLALSSAFLFCVISIAASLLTAEKRHLPIVLNSISYYFIPLSAILGAALCWRQRYSKPEAASNKSSATIWNMPVVFPAFMLLSIMIMTHGSSALISKFISNIFFKADSYAYYSINQLSLPQLMQQLESLLAYLICPILALIWLKNSLQKNGRFHALCVVWMFALISSPINSIVSLFAKGNPSDIAWGLTMALDSNTQIYILGIILFMAYLAATKNGRLQANGLKKNAPHDDGEAKMPDVAESPAEML